MPTGRPGVDRLDRLLGGAARPDGGGPQVGPQGYPDADPGPELVEGVSPGRHRSATVPLLSVPTSLRSVDLRVGAQAVRGLLVLALVALLVLGGRWVWAQRGAAVPQEDRVAVGETGPGDGGEVPVDGQTQGAPPEAGAPAEGAALVGEAAPTEAAGAAGPQVLVVHVTGAVGRPGVVEVPSGSRVVDALRAAGGLTEEADESSLNLARLLLDGERVWVGRPGEAPPAVLGPAPTAGGGTAGAGGGASAAGAGAGPAPLLDLNLATQADLEELPGIGPVTAGHILAWRDEHGRFSTVEELLEVSGIGERTLAQLEPLVTVGG